METISQRIDNVTELKQEYRSKILPAPPSVKIELTSNCNFKCSYCAHGGAVSKECGDMDIELFKKIAKDMYDSGVRELGMFYIGESLLYKRLAYAIKYAKELGFPYVFLTTNGSMATEDKLKDIMEAGLDSLKFSLNHANKWQFRQITGVNPSLFDKTIENVKKAWMIREKHGFKTRLYASSIKYNGKQLEDMKKLIDEIRPFVDEHYWLPLLSFGDAATGKEKELGYMPVYGNPGRADNMRPALPCWAVFKEGHVTFDGKLSACCFDASDKWIMSDLNKVKFMDGWNSEEFQELREAHLVGDVSATDCAVCAGQGKA